MYLATGVLGITCLETSVSVNNLCVCLFYEFGTRNKFSYFSTIILNLLYGYFTLISIYSLLLISIMETFLSELVAYYIIFFFF